MYIIVAGNISEDNEVSLTKLGFKIIPTFQNTNVLKPLQYHADMQLSLLGNTLVCEPTMYEFYAKSLRGSGIKLVCGKNQTQCNYPKDVAYNIKVIENNVFHNFKHTDPVLLEHIKGYQLIDVSQGYSGCSICRAGRDAIITSDTVIHAAAISNGIDSLLISPGHISLPGFDYGFVGGASLWHKGCVYFFGDVTKHPDYARMERFFQKQGSRICTLGTGELFDYGSAFTFD